MQQAYAGSESDSGCLGRLLQKVTTTLIAWQVVAVEINVFTHGRLLILIGHMKNGSIGRSLPLNFHGERSTRDHGNRSFTDDVYRACCGSKGAC
jgi:hypothetical protein